MRTAFEPAAYATVFTPKSQRQSLKALQASCTSATAEVLSALKTSDRGAFDHAFFTRELSEMQRRYGVKTQDTYSFDLSQVSFSAISFDTIHRAFDPACLITVIAARPLNELVAHLFARKVPSALLVARCVKVVALAAFTWHFYDELLLSYSDKLVHSVRGKVEVMDMFEEGDFRDCRPFLLKEARFFQVIDDQPMSIDEAFDFARYKTISTQVIVDICKQNNPFFESFAALKYFFYRIFTGKLSAYEVFSYLRG